MVNGNRICRVWKSCGRGQVVLAFRIEWIRYRLERRLVKCLTVTAEKTLFLSQKLDRLLLKDKRYRENKETAEERINRLYDENQCEDALRELQKETVVK